MQLERRFMSTYDTEFWHVLIDNAWTVISDCVETQGIGGWIEAGKPYYGFEAIVD